MYINYDSEEPITSREDAKDAALTVLKELKSSMYGYEYEKMDEVVIAIEVFLGK